MTLHGCHQRVSCDRAGGMMSAGRIRPDVGSRGRHKQATQAWRAILQRDELSERRGQNHGKETSYQAASFVLYTPWNPRHSHALLLCGCAVEHEVMCFFEEETQCSHLLNPSNHPSFYQLYQFNPVTNSQLELFWSPLNHASLEALFMMERVKLFLVCS